MIGNNTLNLNQATINEALQEYLEKRTKGVELKVTNVTKASDRGFNVYMVEVEALEPLMTVEVKDSEDEQR